MAYIVGLLADVGRLLAKTGDLLAYIRGPLTDVGCPLANRRPSNQCRRLYGRSRRSFGGTGVPLADAGGCLCVTESSLVDTEPSGSHFELPDRYRGISSRPCGPLDDIEDCWTIPGAL